MLKRLYDKRLLNFLVIIFITIISVNWTFYIFKENVSLSFLSIVIALRCISSFSLLRDYMASWRKSTQKTFLRKVFVNIPVFIIVAISFYGEIRFALIFSEFLSYLLLLNLSVYCYWYATNKSRIQKTKKAIVYGAGVAGVKIAEELYNTEYMVKYFVDDSSTLQKRSVDGRKILSVAQLKHKLLTNEYDLLIIALPKEANKRIKRIYKSFQKDFKQIKIMPPLEDVLQDESYTAQLKPVSLYDLLSRDSKSLDEAAISGFIKDKIVLVTGGGGSIGSEIVRQCTKYKAKKIILVDHSEYNLYEVSEELGLDRLRYKLASVCDIDKIRKIFDKYRPSVVFHAAAYKHVPLVEGNAVNAIKNNVLGTKNVIDVSIEKNVESFILVSTDKAVRPTNIMGATKRVCELYLQNVDPKSTKLAAVRFGNVLGSSGSVIPKFERQLKLGGPLTVTHPEITRYFMLIPEACELVLQAGAIAKNSEVFVLDMGAPVKILDLAEQFRKLCGREDVEIKITGLRPGEKLYEELLIEKTDVRTIYKDIFVGRKTFYEIESLATDIEKLLSEKNSPIEMLKKIVPEFEHRLNG
ncbi:polysaccharide biosynthesis protein [Francisella adeliensis]|uniref:Polysaccharide biosynthesis protein n=1 Tax=Francisella adeliensis TaxID=2007306 RepID=A0A2Z4XY24_9GAMM|nr:nucleoside-diphosphate sugar epimerase/dehydratase [Francisella adeliensis]AXA33382.1 dTDP-glucose 4,6-dehydratase [Francisella adeliensis]MBK2085397.1 polysaccharide biosynthesis protein [Francisella adeliensis]MBK2097127.1 polysaccharide biosynthesis protein [Francisella adeliensis]QIW11610.1 polysaccharide biosynthesis protein [Francisella adeliensis]QIW13485.1 polysaccharide biosynthesis protein [Francisella adeliensis]